LKRLQNVKTGSSSATPCRGTAAQFHFRQLLKLYVPDPHFLQFLLGVTTLDTIVL
jgi:hypothetical protein